MNGKVGIHSAEIGEYNQLAVFLKRFKLKIYGLSKDINWRI